MQYLNLNSGGETIPYPQIARRKIMDPQKLPPSNKLQKIYSIDVQVYYVDL